MMNIDRLARHITINGPNGILIHTVPKTNNWIVAQKIEIDKWLITLMNPMGNVTFNLGTVNNKQHLELWMELIKMEIETKASQIRMANELRNKINNFLKQYAKKKNRNKKRKAIK